MHSFILRVIVLCNIAARNRCTTKMTDTQNFPVSVFVLQYESLGVPFGICDDTTALRYYESSYSVSKCRLQCQADSLYTSCGCIDSHMPGNGKIN